MQANERGGLWASSPLYRLLRTLRTTFNIFSAELAVPLRGTLNCCPSDAREYRFSSSIFEWEPLRAVERVPIGLRRCGEPVRALHIVVSTPGFCNQLRLVSSSSSTLPKTAWPCSEEALSLPGSLPGRGALWMDGARLPGGSRLGRVMRDVASMATTSGKASSSPPTMWDKESPSSSEAGGESTISTWRRSRPLTDKNRDSGKCGSNGEKVHVFLSPFLVFLLLRFCCSISGWGGLLGYLSSWILSINNKTTIS